MKNEELHNLACEVYKSQGVSDYTDGYVDGFMTGYRDAELRWDTGDPTEFGDYLTTRESKLSGKRYVAINQWATDSCCRYPLPKSCSQGWQFDVADGSKVIGWIKIDNIKPM